MSDTTAPLDPRPLQDAFDACYPYSLVKYTNEEMRTQQCLLNTRGGWRPATWHRPLAAWWDGEEERQA